MLAGMRYSYLGVLVLTAVARFVIAQTPSNSITFERIQNSNREPQNWLTYSGNNMGQRYSALKQITPQNAKNLEMAWLWQARSVEKFEATSIVVGGPGKEVWDFYQGPLTIGLVPRETRAARVAHIKRASEFAKECGVAAVQTHCGFIPENPNEVLYKETIAAMREVAEYCKRNGQNFRYETGQETPITLVRAIRDVGLDNQGVNFDLANLILYGKANPVDAIEILGPYVQGIHAKDGLWPTNPKDLGEEVAIGKGKVDFPTIIARLKEMKYSGAVTIEREISGTQQMEDVRGAKEYLEKLIG